MHGPRVDGAEDDRIFDFLEGQLPAPEEKAFCHRLESDAPLSQRVEKARSFLKVLHRMTGCLGLTAREIARRMEEMEGTLRDYRAVRTHTYWSRGEEPRSERLVHYYKAPDRMRIEHQSGEKGLRVIVYHGAAMFAHDPERNAFFRVQAEQGGIVPLPRYASDLLRKARATPVDLVGTEMVNGRLCYHLVFAEEGVPTGAVTLHHLWIDRETWIWVRMERCDAVGRLEYRWETEFLVINEGVPDDLFVLDPPPGVTVREETIPEGMAPPEEIELERAREILAGRLLILPEAEDRGSLYRHRIHRVRAMGRDAVILEYRRDGHSVPYLMVHECADVGELAIQDGQQLTLPGGEEGRYRRWPFPPLSGWLAFRRGGLQVMLMGPDDPAELSRWAGRLQRANR